MKKVSNKKGFTLAELLIVVAIIAILVAIAIPVFGNALNKAKLATDLANVRAAYAEAVVEKMTADDYAGSITLTITGDLQPAAPNSTVTVDAGKIVVTLNNVTPVLKDDFAYDSDVTIS